MSEFRSGQLQWLEALLDEAARGILAALSDLASAIGRVLRLIATLPQGGHQVMTNRKSGSSTILAKAEAASKSETLPGGGHDRGQEA